MFVGVEFYFAVAVVAIIDGLLWIVKEDLDLILIGLVVKTPDPVGVGNDALLGKNGRQMRCIHGSFYGPGLGVGVFGDEG